MNRYLRQAASGVLLAAPALAIPALTIPAAAAAAGPATAPACHQPGRHPPAPPGPDTRPDSRAGPGHHGRAEQLIGNLHPAPGTAVPAAATISFLIAGEQPFPAPASGDAAVTVNGVPVTAAAGPPETGVPVTYPGHHGKPPRPASCEIPFTFTLPATATGTVHIQVTAHDSDGNHDTARWTLTVQATTVPAGAVGGIAVTATAGLALLTLQARRRHHTPPAPS